MFAQIVAIFIFLGMFLLIILDKFERHYVTLGSGALVLTLVFGVCMHSFRAIWETLNLGTFFNAPSGMARVRKARSASTGPRSFSSPV